MTRNITHELSLPASNDGQTRLIDGEEHMRASSAVLASFGLMLLASTSVDAQEWKRACSEGETCAIDGVRLVRYGADGSFSYGVATNQLICSQGSFGDPGPRTGKKACWYQETETELGLSSSLAEREQELGRLREDVERLESESAALRAELNDAYAELDTIYRRLGPGQVRRLERAIRRNRDRDDRR
jgi:hypothetical protein